VPEGTYNRKKTPFLLKGALRRAADAGLISKQVVVSITGVAK
jgi:hypothetical protein